MKLVAATAIALSLCLCCLAADEPMFPEQPDSPAKLLEILKTSGERYAISRFRLNYVKESDLPRLVALLDSKETCAFIDLSSSSIYYPGKSTVGHEAAYLIEGFWKRYYPTGLTSQQYKPDIAAIKQWYRLWSHLQQLEKTVCPAKGNPPVRSETGRMSAPAVLQRGEAKLGSERAGVRGKANGCTRIKH